MSQVATITVEKQQQQQQQKSSTVISAGVTSAMVADALKAQKPAATTFASSSVSSSASSLVPASGKVPEEIADYYPGITKEAFAIAARNAPDSLVFAEKGQKFTVQETKKTNQKQVFAQWKQQQQQQQQGGKNKVAACANQCPVTFKWYGLAPAKNAAGEFLSPFPHGHCRVTRWNARGQRHGREEFYDYCGRLYHTIEWLANNRIGNEMWYDVATGQVSRIVPWVAGATVKKSVVKDGKKMWKIVRRRSTITGIEKRFEGPIDRTITWSKGKRHGLERAVHVRNGVVLCERMWVNGESDGAAVCKYKNGKLAHVVHYAVGRKHGDEVTYFRSGQERSVVPFYNGLRHGTEYWTQCVKQPNGTNVYSTKEQYWCMGEKRESPMPANAFEACNSTVGAK